MTAPLCQCGCGEPVNRSKRGEWNRYVRFHHRHDPQVIARSIQSALETHGTRERNQQIVKRVRAGEAMADVAAETGVSRQRVEQLVHRDRQLARVAAHRAVEAGSLTRPDHCQSCGTTGPVQIHHADYSQPLAVIFVCERCHPLLDAARQRREAGDVVADADADSLLTTTQASRRAQVCTTTFRKVRKIIGIRSVRRRGHALFRPAEVDRAFAEYRALNGMVRRCKYGHRLTADNRTGKLRHCKACNARRVNETRGGRRTKRTTQHVMRSALKLAGYTITKDHTGALAVETPNGPATVTAGGGSKWKVRVNGHEAGDSWDAAGVIATLRDAAEQESAA